MSCCDRPYYKAPPCPNCGEVDDMVHQTGARMKNSSWNHDFWCCSDECGKDFIYKLENSPRYKRAKQIKEDIEDLKSHLRSLINDIQQGEL